MFTIENRLTDADVHRAMAAPITPTQLAGSYTAYLEAMDLFADQFVNVVLNGLMAPTDRETVLKGLFVRAHGFCKTAIVLGSVVHFQSLVSAERSSLELHSDIELIHRNVFPDGVERFLAFAHGQKLKSARRAVDFFTAHQEMDTTPSQAEPHQNFISSQAVHVEAELFRFWQNNAGTGPRTPQHWTDLNLIARTELLNDAELLRIVMERYDVRNFAVHTGLAGVFGVDRTGLEILCALSLQGIAELFMKDLRLVGQAFGLHAPITDYYEQLDVISRTPHWSVVDKRLITMGEEPRFILHR